MPYTTTATRVTRADGSYHNHDPKPRCKNSLTAADIQVSVVEKDGRLYVRLDNDYDFESLRNRYSGTKRTTIGGTRDELLALYAQIGEALGL